MTPDKRLLSAEELQELRERHFRDIHVTATNCLTCRAFDHIAALQEQADHDTAGYMDALVGSRKRIDKLEAQIAAVRVLCETEKNRLSGGRWYMWVPIKDVLTALKATSEQRSDECVEKQT
jgi:hypothetical protein